MKTNLIRRKKRKNGYKNVSPQKCWVKKIGFVCLGGEQNYELKKKNGVKKIRIEKGILVKKTF